MMVPLAASSGYVVIAVAVGFACLLLLYLFRVEDRAVGEDREHEAQGLGPAGEEPIAHSLIGGSAAAGRLAPPRDRTATSPDPQRAPTSPPAPARPAPAYSPAPVTPEPRPPLPDPQGQAPEPTLVVPQPGPPLPDPQGAPPEPAPRAPVPVARAPEPPPRAPEPPARAPVPAETVLPAVPPPDAAVPAASGRPAGLGALLAVRALIRRWRKRE